MITLLGIRKVEFTRKEDGAKIGGYRIFTSDTDMTNMVCGVGGYDFFLSDEKAAELKVLNMHPGDQLQIIYNRFGKVDSLEVL